MPDPWLTKKGDVVPALKAAGMPEWVGNDGCHRRLRQTKDGQCPIWFVDSRHPRAEDWTPLREVTPHEAAAINEKWLREKLEAQYAVDGAAVSFQCDGPDGYCCITVFTPDGTVRPLGEGGTYPEALQAAALAAKEREP